MQLLAHLVHEKVENQLELSHLNILKRQAARGILIQQNNILLMYTERYDDFSFPGGGVEFGEDLELGLRRELREEAGAVDFDILAPYGKVTEYQPTWKPQWDLMFQTSYWFRCRLNSPLGEAALEAHEVNNGMHAEWVPLQDAIRHNESVLKRNPPTMGISIGRETLVMRHLRDSLSNR